MTNPSSTLQTDGKTGSKIAPPPAWRFEIIDDGRDSDDSVWSELGRNLEPLATAASNALGDLYVSIAKVALEWKEELEDRRAERKARERVAVGSARSANPAPEMHLIKGSGPRKRAASAAKSSLSKSRGL